MAMNIIMDMIVVISMKDHHPDSQPSSARRRFAEDRVAELFRHAGWRVSHAAVPPGVDLVVSRRHRKFLAVVKASSESRRDRLGPLLAAALLEARAAARSSAGGSPLAVVAARRIPERLIADLRDYAAHVAGDVGVGIVDVEGAALFVGNGLEGVGEPQPLEPPRRLSEPRWNLSRAHAPVQPFSDLNQWMLKVLLAERIPPDLLNCPRASIKSIPQLAKLADVSLPSAFRLVRYLREAGFALQGEPLELVRVSKLLERWRAASIQSRREIGLRWLIPSGRPQQQFHQMLLKAQSHAPPDELPRWRSKPPLSPGGPRACLALFSAAQALGFGHVHGVADHFYVGRHDLPALESLGLAGARPDERADVFATIARHPRSVFRGAVEKDGVYVSDILQVWLDVSEHPARGNEQAADIWNRLLSDIAGRGSDM